VLNRLARWSLDRPRLIAWACAWLLVCGLVFVRDIKVAFLPDIAPAEAVVQTEAQGLVAEQVEQLVTRPVESALAGTTGVARVHSESAEGLSTIILTFADGANPFRVRQALLENLASLGRTLPAGVASPRLSPLAASGGDALQVGFTSDRLDPMALRDLVEWTVRPRLLAAPGVARVALYGGQIRRIEVRARPGDLSDSDLGFLDILNATRRATGVAGAGFIDTPTQRIVIEPHGQALTTDAVGAGQIQTPGADPVRINDVADVFEAPAPQFGDALIDGKPGVLVSIAGQYGANRMDVTHAVEAALDALRPALASSGVRVDTTLDRPASFIARTVRGVALDLLVGTGLIAIALFLLLRDAPAALISLLAIPISLLLAIVGVRAAGWTINAMTLGGLAVALGVVIDDAVIDIENILARLREAEQRHASRADAILAASVEVRGPVVYATLAVIVSVLPLLLLRGEQGALLAPMAGAIIAACLASLFVAAVVTPALSHLLLGHVKPGAERHPGRLDAAYRDVLARLGAAPRAVALGALLVVALALGCMLFARPVLLPSIHDDHLAIQITAPPATSLDVMRDYGVRITHDLQRLAGVASVTQKIGRDPTGDDSAGLERATFDVGLTPGLGSAGQETIAAHIRHDLSLYPGLNPIVRSRFDAARDGARTTAPFSVSVYGPDLDALDATAARIVEALKTVPGGGNAQVDSDSHAPVVRVDVDFQRLAIYGLSAADVLDTIQAAFAGERVAQVYQDGRAIDLAVTAQDTLRRDPEAVGELLLRSPSGFSVPLRSVANVYLTDGRPMIAHDGGLRRQVVIADPPPRGIARFTAAARRAIARNVALPPGAFVEIADAGRTAAQAGQALAINYGLSTFAIFALLAIAFDSRSATLILASTLFSFVGGAIAVLAMGGAPSVGAIAGFIALLGLSMRSAILLITRLEDLVVSGHAPWSFATVVQATRERINPLSMSAILVALGLMPFAVRANAAGHEILGPMAIVIIAGLVTSTLASLFLLPVLIFSFWRPGLARLARRHRTTNASSPSNHV
jgi:CzcA family heavy metal efflux pump